MTALDQWHKDYDYAEEQIDESTHPHGAFADGAEYARKQIALRLRKLAAESEMDPNLDQSSLPLDLKDLIEELEAP